MLSLLYLKKKEHEHPPNKLIMTKFIIHAISMINNKAFLGFIDKIS